MKLLIATPCLNNSLDSRMVGSVLNVILEGVKRGDEVVWDRPSSAILSYNRNVSMDKAIKENFDWFLYWDADIEVSSVDFVYGMIDTSFKYQAAIVGLPVRLKGSDKYNFAFKDEKYINGITLPPEPALVDVIGTGVMLLDVSMVRDIPKPWFTFTDTYNDKPGFWPEDWNFCEKATQIGRKVYVDPRYETIHWGTYGYR